MNRTELNDYIDENITDKTEPGSISPTDEGGALKAVADYVDKRPATLSNDTEATTNVLTAANTDFDYDLNIWRSGDTVHIVGTIRNKTGSDSLTARDIATFGADWLPVSSGQPYRYTADDTSTPPKQMRINVTATKLYMATNLNDQNDHIVNISYPAST